MKKNIPVMLYDGDCGFCMKWIEKWRRATGELVAYEPYQKALVHFPQLSEKQCQESIQLVMPEGVFFSGAKAVFKALHWGGKAQFLFWSYEHVPFFAPITEGCYRLVARNRMFFSKLFAAPECKL